MAFTVHAWRFAALCLLGVGAARAQTPNPSDVVNLTPFEENISTDKSYGALNSNSLTQFNAALDKLPITADIFTEAFMSDTASESVEQMVQAYSAGAGLTSADPASSAGTTQPLDRNSNSGITLRGLSNTLETRDGFFPMNNSTGTGYTSTFDLERVEVINGPQSLLYGTGGPGGVINLVSKQARLGAPATASVMFRVDQYGNRLGQADYDVSSGRIAVRVDVLDQTVGGRREDIGGPLHGYYSQIAVELLRGTVIRLSGEQTTFNYINSSNLTLAAASTSNDARNGDYLHYLLATNQVQAAANKGASGAGPIDNGLVNWGNVDSFGGWWNSELTVNEWAELTAETEWSSWLSTQLSLAYNNHSQDWVSTPLTFSAPNLAANTLPGQWAVGLTSAFPATDTEEPARTKAIRFSALSTNDLFAGRWHSQTVLGIDDIETNAAQINYSYYLANSAYQVVVTPSSTVNQGRTTLPKLYWPIGTRLLAYPYWAPRASPITVNGSYYVRMIENQPNPALVSANDPLGVTLGGPGFQKSQTEQSGLYGLNLSQLDGGKLDTLAGFRLSRSFEQLQNQGSAPPVPGNPTQDVDTHSLSFNVGADYAVQPWLHPYAAVSESFNPPTTQQEDPYGREPQTEHALGEEVGMKVHTADGRLSGSFAVYHIQSNNEEFAISSSLVNDINPTGLNGRYSSPSNWINVDRSSQGVQAILTAAPTPAWRMRLSAGVTDGKIDNTTQYGQLYNDQFYENSKGQVTYADGTVVYVNATFNSKAPTASSTAAGAVPLTVALMNTASSTYYASPAPITGQILGTSNVAKVLATVDAAHGSILTGLTGLPISQQQISPAANGIAIPGSIVTSRGGDVTTGYPELGLDFTSLYTLPSGPLAGLQLGGEFLGGWYNRGYYYYANGVLPNSSRQLYDYPTLTQFNGIFGYRRKYHRVTFHSQLNITNVFNRYQVVLLPNGVTGWSTPVGVNATFSEQPRYYVWTNTVEF